MDPKPYTLDLFRNLGHEVRWPTAIWLLCDVMDLLACDAKYLLGELIDDGLLVHDRGWLSVKKG